MRASVVYYSAHKITIARTKAQYFFELHIIAISLQRENYKRHTIMVERTPK